MVAGTKLRRAGGVTIGGECGDKRDAEEKVGRVGGRVRDKSELRLDHRFLGFLEF